ncbi:MAG TPA: TetR/AcrR family transcriptional regulator, partial [Solirubrobacteraceae bacterium]
AASDVVATRFLLSETLAGGRRTLDVRDQVIAEIAERIDASYQQLSAGSVVPDLSSRIVVGGVWRLLSSALLDEEPDLSGLAEELGCWIEFYEQPAGRHRWRTLAPVAVVVSSPPLLPDSPLRAPAVMARGRPRMSKEQVAENHRQRILAATVEVAKSKGYTAASIADITRAADVDVRVFHGLFTGKQDAFLAAHELGVQRTMAQTASAFFAGTSWPERVWEAGRAFTGFLEANPLITHMGFVEAYAVGGDAVKRLEDSRAGFTIFLQEGYQAYPQQTPPSRVALEAIAATTFELAYCLAREEAHGEMSGLLPNIVDLALTPFTGSTEANRFIDEKLEQAVSSA